MTIHNMLVFSISDPQTRSWLNRIALEIMSHEFQKDLCINHRSKASEVLSLKYGNNTL